MTKLNSDFTYSLWFERCDDGESWAFTMSGDSNDEKNLDVEELEFAFNNISFKYKAWVNTIQAVGIDPDGRADFHFSDGTVSPSSAYQKDCYIFLEMINMICLGYIHMISSHDIRVSEWIENNVKINVK